MKRRLFLTGPIGCGKSTAIAQALGDKLPQCGGFLTRRYRKPYLHFTLESPDGRQKATFLDFSDGSPKVDMDVFTSLGLACLAPKNAMILDEIGGIELLNPEFTAALDSLLTSGAPTIGVIKGEGPAGALIESLGLSEAYEQAVHQLRQRLKNDPDTLVYTCGQYDETALLLAKQWVEEYLHDEN